MNVRRTVTAVISAAVALPLPSLVVAQVPPDAGLQVDRIFEPWSSVNSPGCAVGVSKDGLTIFSRGYGMADLEHDVRNSAETIFEGGSLSKQFTAAAIMLLVMDGKLSLDAVANAPRAKSVATPREGIRTVMVVPSFAG